MAQKILFVRFVRQGGKLDITKIQEVVAPFLGVSPNEISEATLISRSEIQGSVKIHRLRSELRKHGFDSDDWDNVVCVGDLVRLRTGSVDNLLQPIAVGNESSTQESPNSASFNIGIDVEFLDSMPKTDDYYSEQFYVDNFSKKEIAYCSRQQNPRRCFVGRFALKEAIYKANKGICAKEFNKIEIDVDSDGGVVNKDCAISVSHLRDVEAPLSIAVAINRGEVNGANPSSKLITSSIKVDNHAQNSSDVNVDYSRSRVQWLLIAGIYVIISIDVLLRIFF